MSIWKHSFMVTAFSISIFGDLSRHIFLLHNSSLFIKQQCCYINMYIVYGIYNMYIDRFIYVHCIEHIYIRRSK